MLRLALNDWERMFLDAAYLGALFQALGWMGLCPAAAAVDYLLGMSAMCASFGGLGLASGSLLRASTVALRLAGCGLGVAAVATRVL